MAMDSLQLTWCHFLVHSTGALAAAMMCWLYPEHVGSIMVVDTPIITSRIVRNDVLRRDLEKAKQDVNVSERDKMESLRVLKEEVEVPPPFAGDPSPGDIAAYREIFPASDKWGVSAAPDWSHFLSPQHISSIRHPMFLIVPNAHPACDVATMRSCFNVRKSVAVKGAEAHADLLTEQHAPEISSQVEQWVRRYDANSIISRRWTEAKNAAAKLKSPVEATAATGSGAAEVTRPKSKRKQKDADHKKDSDHKKDADHKKESDHKK